MAQSGKIRIIGGKWRSRKLQFPAIKDLRPSPDAVRETLFNWLRDDIENSNCLDLFAGSGAIGFEAASRGALHVTMVEAHPQAARQLTMNARLLDADTCIEIITAKAENFIASCDRQFNCIFLDPPFNADIVQKICLLLAASQIIADDATIYLETRKSRDPLPIPDSWHIIRDKCQGIVQSTLIETNL